MRGAGHAASSPPPAAEVGAGPRVCLVADGFGRAYGGGMLRFQRYLPGLRARGIQPLVFTSAPSEVKARIAGAAPEAAAGPAPAAGGPEWVDGTPVYRVRLPSESRLRRDVSLMGQLLAFCRDGRRRPDVVQLLSLRPAALPWIAALRRQGVAVVLTTTIVAEPPRGGVRRALRHWLQRLALERVDCVVAGSGAMLESVRACGARTRAEVIGHGVDLQRFRPASGPAEREAVRRALGIPTEAPLLLFVGGVSPRKGVDLLLEAWARTAPRHPDAHLVIVGPRRDQADPSQRDFGARIEALRAASGAGDRVHFAGMVPDPERWLRAADLFVFASRREGMPNVVLEAMAAGLPVVTTRFLGLSPELGQAGRDYRLVEPDADALHAEVDRLLEDEAARRAVGRAARRWVEETMDVAATLERYAALYRELTAPAGRTVRR